MSAGAARMRSEGGEPPVSFQPGDLATFVLTDDRRAAEDGVARRVPLGEYDGERCVVQGVKDVSGRRMYDVTLWLPGQHDGMGDTRLTVAEEELAPDRGDGEAERRAEIKAVADGYMTAYRQSLADAAERLRADGGPVRTTDF
jgi:hypothetical protein